MPTFVQAIPLEMLLQIPYIPPVLGALVVLSLILGFTIINRVIQKPAARIGWTGPSGQSLIIQGSTDPNAFSAPPANKSPDCSL